MEQIVAYIGQLVQTDLWGSDVDIRIPWWPIDLLEDIHFIATVNCWYKQSKIKVRWKICAMDANWMMVEWLWWSVNQYVIELWQRGNRVSGFQKLLEEEMKSLFKPCKAELIDSPYVVVDTEGWILVWYLPGFLGPQRQVSGIVNLLKIDWIDDKGFFVEVNGNHGNLSEDEARRHTLVNQWEPLPPSRGMSVQA